MINLKSLINESTDRKTIDRFKLDLEKIVPKILGSTEKELKGIKVQPNTFSGTYNIIIRNPFDNGDYSFSLNYPEYMHSSNIESKIKSVIEKTARKYKLVHSNISTQVGLSNAVYSMSIK
jgi:hypothetical protein